MPAGPAGMAVSEFAATTLGALIGVGSWAAGSMLDDALNLRHRHPLLDVLVRAGKVPVWVARRVATATANAELSDDDARAVDAATAADFARLPFDRAMKILQAELLRAPSSTLAAQQAEAQQKQYAKKCRSNDAGMSVYIAQLTAGTTITRQAVTRHLTVLAEAGLVHDLWRGRERLWAFEPSRLDEARKALDAINAEWAGALSRLQRFVED